MTSLALNKNVLGRCDKEEVEEKYLQYMKEVEVDWDRCGGILKQYFREKTQLTNDKYHKLNNPKIDKHPKL